MPLTLLILSFVPILVIPFWIKKFKNSLLTFSLLYSILLFNLSLNLLFKFSWGTLGYQLISTISFYNIPAAPIFKETCGFAVDGFYQCILEISHNFSSAPILEGLVNCGFAVDGLSLWLIILTTFLLPPCVLYSYIYRTDPNLKFYLFLLFMLNFCLIFFFLTTNLLFFYIFFEMVLIPVFLQILIWGSRSRKILAGLYFFLYTFFGSIFFLFSIFILYSITGSYDLAVLLNYTYTAEIQLLLWPCIAVAFMIKVPMLPFHLWLPEAHVEAPTVSSVYLASLLLKLGSYGILRVLLPIFPYGTLVYTPLAQLISLLGVLYCSGIILRQVDLKKIIAYSSIIHMNMAVFGLFTYNAYGIQGSILLMIAHGLTSGALFLMIGMLYDRFKSRLLPYFGGLFLIMPLYSALFIIFSFSNVGFPGTVNFMSELLLFVGIINYGLLTKTFFGAVIMAIGLFSSVCYSIWLINKLLFGNFKDHLVGYDLTEREVLCLVPFVLFIFLFGLTPTILSFTELFTQKLLVLFNLI